MSKKSVRNPSQVEKKKYACCVLYPDSESYNCEKLISELASQHITFAVSPIHDMDLKEDGSNKKPHFHLLVAYPNATTLNNFKSLFEICGLQKSDLHMVEFCNSGIGYFRYLTHKDNPEKAQYDDCQIRIYNDYDGIFDKFRKTEIDKTNNLIRIFQLVDELDTVSFHSLMQFLMLNEVELFKMITSSSALAICIKEYQRSFEYDKKQLKE